jgi:hypothetical protein
MSRAISLSPGKMRSRSDWWPERVIRVVVVFLALVVFLVDLVDLVVSPIIGLLATTHAFRGRRFMQNDHGFLYGMTV